MVKSIIVESQNIKKMQKVFSPFNYLHYFYDSVNIFRKELNFDIYLLV